jgi:hypothetical protein
MKAWSNIKHERALEKRRQKNKQKKLNEMFNLNGFAAPRTVILDANKSTEPSTQTIDKYQANINEVI